jgi:hypothetical protein
MRSTVLVLVVAIACGNDHAAPPTPDAPKPIDAAIDASNPNEPSTLFGTGLCVDEACTMIASDVMQYAPEDPNYVLWADFAQKKRWLYLPPGAQIDTSDANHWVFPQGTKIWKEFDLPGSGSDGPLVRVETRYIYKAGSDEAGTGSASPWFYISYQWDSMVGGDTQGSSATAVPNGVTNANGTNHDIPSRGQCKNCHEDLLPGRVLGLGALSLDFHETGSGLFDLDDLIAQDLLTVPPPGASSPHYPLPADATGSDILALEYAHTNCGECHNPSSPVDLQVPVLFRMDANALGSGGVAATTLFATTIGQAGTPILDGSDAHGNCPGITDPSGGVAPLFGCTDLVVGPWQANHPYNFNDRVVAGGNTYLCSTKGTQMGTVFPCGTSGTTPPTGTGSGVITDGSATWIYIGAPSTRSILIYRYETTNIGKHMPPAGENITDPTGDAIFNAWLTALP